MKQHPQITIRLPKSLHAALLGEAERRNTTLADATRTCLSEHFNHASVVERLDKIQATLDNLMSEE